MPKRSAAAVADTRAAVTEAALRRASVDGLEGVTIGRLAEELEMSKSGLFGLFGSKEELQSATFQAAVELYLRDVWEPVEELTPGRERLLALCDRWLAFTGHRELPGGCILTTASVEFDARPGPVRDAVAAAMRLLLGRLEEEISIAIDAGELPAGTDSADTAFQLLALASTASWSGKLADDPEMAERARRGMRRLLGEAGR